MNCNKKIHSKTVYIVVCNSVFLHSENTVSFVMIKLYFKSCTVCLSGIYCLFKDSVPTGHGRVPGHCCLQVHPGKCSSSKRETHRRFGAIERGEEGVLSKVCWFYTTNPETTNDG